MDEEDFMKMVDREIREIGNRTMDDYIQKMVYGEGTGEPIGILNTPGMRIIPTRITKEAP